MRAVRAAIAAMLIGGCWYSGNFGANTRRPDFGNERDPDPMADPNRQVTESPYVAKEQPAPATNARERVKRRKKPKSEIWGSVLGAALAWGAGGWMPMASASGKFEEDPTQADRYEADEAAAKKEAAEEAERQKRKAPVEAAPTADP